MPPQQPNAGQIRAALGLLRWENDDLAKACNITSQSVSNIKRGVTRPQPRILSAMRHVLESQGIEFLDHSGVRHKPEGVEVLNGKEGVDKFGEMIYAFAQTSSGIIRQNGIADNLFGQWAPEADVVHRTTMTALLQKKKDVHVRAILKNGDCNFACTAYANYRWHPKHAPPPVPYYIFGNSIGIFAFDADPPPKIILITSPTIALTYSNQFDRTWDVATVPPQLLPLKKQPKG